VGAQRIVLIRAQKPIGKTPYCIGQGVVASDTGGGVRCGKGEVGEVRRYGWVGEDMGQEGGHSRRGFTRGEGTRDEGWRAPQIEAQSANRSYPRVWLRQILEGGGGGGGGGYG